MGQCPSAKIGYGVFIDEEKCLEISRILEERDPEGWTEGEENISEYFYDSKIEFEQIGSYDFDNYIVSVKGSMITSYGWCDLTEVNTLDIPDDLSALDKFCDTFNIEKDYQWILGSCFG